MRTKYTLTHEEIRDALAALLAHKGGMVYVAPNDLEFDADENGAVTVTLTIEE